MGHPGFVLASKGSAHPPNYRDFVFRNSLYSKIRTAAVQMYNFSDSQVFFHWYFLSKGVSKMEFKIGDIVQLKSGGPEMTVTGIGDEGLVYCVWFLGPKQNNGHFPPGALDKIR
jgi:uncharacterized protein YodC (DUF2158 family)